MLEFSWITEKLAVGGGIWNAENMAEIARLGFTHIIDMQIEFDDTALAEPYGIAVLWNPTDDDFKPKPPSLFRRGVEFALAALYPGSPSRAAMYQISKQEAAAVMNGRRIRYPAREALVDDPGARIYIHCAAGVHRAPMMTLAVLRALGWSLNDACELIQKRRWVVDFADVYVQSVEEFMKAYQEENEVSPQ